MMRNKQYSGTKKVVYINNYMYVLAINLLFCSHTKHAVREESIADMMDLFQF